MIVHMIPIVFRHLLPSSILDSDIPNFNDLSIPESQESIFDALTEHNAHTLFSTSVSHEDHSEEEYFYCDIVCNYFHFAIQLQRVDIVKKLLQWNVDFYVPLQYILKSTLFSVDEEGIDEKNSSNNLTLTPLKLAEEVGNAEIITLLIAAENNTKKISGEAKEAGYETDIDDEKESKPLKPRRYKKRLILGDGNFSYGRALVKKQIEKGFEEFPRALTVTEYADQNSLTQTYSSTETASEFKNFSANISFLSEYGAELLVGIDAKTIDQNFKDRHFKRIHFNFPYYNDSVLSISQKKDKTRELVGKFFESATKMQNPGDRIHMALVTGFRDPVWYEDATYGVGQFCEQYGYVYIKKREFVSSEKKRYPGYFHVKTAGNTSVSTAEDGREFIFEKKIPGKDYHGSSEKKSTSRGVNKMVLKHMDTASDTSSYVEHSDVEEKIARAASKMKTPESAKKAMGYSQAQLLSKNSGIKLSGESNSKKSDSESDISLEDSRVKSLK